MKLINRITALSLVFCAAMWAQDKPSPFATPVPCGVPKRREIKRNLPVSKPPTLPPACSVVPPANANPQEVHVDVSVEPIQVQVQQPASASLPSEMRDLLLIMTANAQAEQADRERRNAVPPQQADMGKTNELLGKSIDLQTQMLTEARQTKYNTARIADSAHHLVQLGIFDAVAAGVQTGFDIASYRRLGGIDQDINKLNTNVTTLNGNVVSGFGVINTQLGGIANGVWGIANKPAPNVSLTAISNSNPTVTATGGTGGLGGTGGNGGNSTSTSGSTSTSNSTSSSSANNTNISDNTNNLANSNASANNNQN